MKDKPEIVLVVECFELAMIDAGLTENRIKIVKRKFNKRMQEIKQG